MRSRFRCLALLLSMAAQALPGLHLEGGPFLPYRINHATATHTDGLLGTVELMGQRWDGTRVPLFRTRVAARSQAVALDFYLDEDIRGLELQVDGQGSDGSVAFDLAAAEGKAGALAAGETALRKRMRGLDPPVHFAPDGAPPERFSLLGSDLVMAGFQASYGLFAVSASRAPLMPLGGFVLAALIATAIASSTLGRRIVARVLTVTAALGATVAIVLLAIPRPTLFSLAFPADGPGVRVSGMVERKVDELPGYTRVTYAAVQGEGASVVSSGTVELVGLWAPTGKGVPVADMVPAGALVRFSSPPLATWVEGELVFGSKDFVTGWVVHAHP